MGRRGCWLRTKPKENVIWTCSVLRQPLMQSCDICSKGKDQSSIRLSDYSSGQSYEPCVLVMYSSCHRNPTRNQLKQQQLQKKVNFWMILGNFYNDQVSGAQKWEWSSQTPEPEKRTSSGLALSLRAEGRRDKRVIIKRLECMSVADKAKELLISLQNHRKSLKHWRHQLPLKVGVQIEQKTVGWAKCFYEEHFNTPVSLSSP